MPGNTHKGVALPKDAAEYQTDETSCENHHNISQTPQSGTGVDALDDTDIMLHLAQYSDEAHEVMIGLPLHWHEPGDRCGICLEEYRTNDRLVVSDCHHAFHMACLKEWLNQEIFATTTGSCPMCRQACKVHLAGSTNSEGLIDYACIEEVDLYPRVPGPDHYPEAWSGDDLDNISELYIGEVEDGDDDYQGTDENDLHYIIQ